MGKYYLGTGNQQINFQVVDSTGVINDLNLSGLYLSITGKAADADKLDNLDSSFFRNATNLTGTYTGSFSGKAADSDLLDGYDSSYFLNGANITGTVELSGTFTGYYTGVFSGTIGHTDYIQFHTGLGINPDPAELTWNDAIGTMQLGLGANIDLRVGFQNYEFVANRNGSTLLKGSAVYISGAQGNRPAVGLALANADSTSSITFAILAEDIAPLNDGYAITNGLLTNLNTTGFAAGATLYLSPTVSGGITSTKPQAPEHNVLLGFCVRSHQSAGEILVKIQNGLELDELHDVRLINKQNNDIVRYNAPSGVWYNSDTLALNGTGSHYISGDLGIGTSDPTAKLHIVGADKRQIIASTTDNAALVLGQWDGATNRIESSTRKLLITSYASGISLGINGSEHVHVSTSGNLGVGTTSPSAKLQVNGSAIVTGSLTVDTSTLFVDATNDRVGIGTAVPEARLDIYHPSNLGNFPDFGKNGARFRRPGVFTEFGYIEYPSGGDKTVLGSFYSGGGYGQITLRQHSSVTSQDSFTLDNSGNANIAGQLSVNVSLAVGTFSPTAKLEVESGGSDTVGMRVMDGVNGVWTEIRRRSIECVGGDFWINGQTSSLDLRTGNVSRLFISSTGVVTFSGAVIASSLTAPALTNLTLAGGSSGASLVLGQGTAASATITPTGAGNISLSGPVQVNGATNNASYKFTVKRATNFQLGVGLQNASSALSLEAFNDTITANVPFAIYGSPLSLMGGNVLLGTFTDGGQKLQVNGDIISNSTSGSNIIANDPTFSEPVIQLREAGVNKAVFKTLIGDAYLSTQTAGKSIYFRSGNATTALTLDASQDATFAGRVSVGNGASKGLTVNSGSGQNLFTMQQAGVEKWVQYLSSGSLVWFNSTLASNALTLNGATSAATFVGSVSINNTAASTGAGSGALQIAGGIYSGATSVFAGNVTVTNNTTPLFLAVDTRTSAGGGIAALSLNTSDQFWQVQNSGGNLLFRDNTGPITALTITKGTGEAAFASTVTATGSASTSVALRLDNATGGGGSAQYYTNFTSGAVVISRLLRGNGLSGYATNGLNIDNFDGFQVGLNILGGSGGAFTVRTGGTTDLFTIASTGASTFAGAVTITGNLTVNGTTTTVNSTTVTVDDPIITLGGDTAPTIDDNKDRGVEFKWHNGTIAKIGFFGFDDSTGYLTFIPDATNTSEVFSGTQGDIQASNFRGNLIGNVTGNVSGSAGSVATLTAGAYLTGGSFNGSAAVTFAVDATSANTASKVVARDASGNFSAGAVTLTESSGIYFGNSARILWNSGSSTLDVVNTAQSAFLGFRALTGGIISTAASTGVNTGALQVAGGAYFAGATYIGSSGTTVPLSVDFSTSPTGGYARFGPSPIGNLDRALIISPVRFLNGFGDIMVGRNLVPVPSADEMKTLVSTGYAGLIFRGGSGATEFVGSATSTAGASITPTVLFSLNNSTGAATFTGAVTVGGEANLSISNSVLNFYSSSTQWWRQYLNGGDSQMRIRDMVNGNTVMTFTGGMAGASRVSFNDNTPSTSISSGAVVVTGGIGVGGAGYFGGAISSGGTITGTSLSGPLANTLTLATSGIGLSGSASFNNSGAATFTVTSNATSANTASTLVARDASGNFSAGTITGTNLDISGNSVQNVGLVRFTNNYSSGSVYYPTARFIQTRGNHSYGVVSEFITNTAADGDRPSILFYGAQGAHSWQVGQITSGWGAVDDFGIGYRTSNTPSSFSSWPTNYFTIKTSGNIGIGTTSPATKLEVYGGNFQVRWASFIGIYVSENSTAIGGDSSLNAAKLTIHGPDSKVYSSSSVVDWQPTQANNGSATYNSSTVNGSMALLQLVPTNSSSILQPAYIAAVSAAGASTYSSSIVFGRRTGLAAYSETMRIDGSGNLGIGTTSPGSLLHLNAASGTPYQTFSLANTPFGYVGAAGAFFSGQGSNFGMYGGGTSKIMLGARNSPDLTIDTTGNIGISATAPSAKLEVALTSDTSGEPTAWDNKYAVLGTGGSSTAGGIFFSYDQTNNRGYIGALTPGTAWRNLILQPNATNGNVGIGTKTPGYRLEVNGSFAATTKSFVILHPTKEGKKLRYGSLEGPENGVYVRGKTTSKVIELPDYWTKLVDPDSISVQLTPIGSHQKLYVEKIENNKVYIANENLLAKNINCFFYILAERADVEKLQVEIDA